MDDTELLKMAGFSTTGMAILMIVWRVLKSVQGKKLVSTCCGRKGEMGVDVVAMTPPPPLVLRRLETVGVKSDTPPPSQVS
jgi:hypothetical protein